MPAYEGFDGESDVVLTSRSYDVESTASNPPSSEALSIPIAVKSNGSDIDADAGNMDEASSSEKLVTSSEMRTSLSDTVHCLNDDVSPQKQHVNSKEMNSVDQRGDGDVNHRVRTIPLQSQSDTNRARTLINTNGTINTTTTTTATTSLFRSKTTVESDCNDSVAFDSLDESTQTLPRSNAGKSRSQSHPNMHTLMHPQTHSHPHQRTVRGSMRGLLLEPNARLSSESLNGPVSWQQPGSVVQKMRWLSGSLVEDPRVQIAIIGLIVINAIMMGISTFAFVENDGTTFRVFEIIDTTLLAVFTIELALQFCYRSIKLFLDPWLVFDFVIIVASWSLTSTQVIRAFRIFRAVRLVTRIGPLRELISAIGAVMPRMYAITMLLLLIFYIYAVLFTELFGEMELSRDYFGTLTQSLFTCMELMTMQWADVAREVMEQKHWAWAPFTSYIALTGFIVFNLIVAVVCDAVALIDRAAKEERDGPQESDANKLLEAQERIFELSKQVAAMQSQHTLVCRAMEHLTDELKYALAALQMMDVTESDSDTECVFNCGDGIKHTDLLGEWPRKGNI